MNFTVPEGPINGSTTITVTGGEPDGVVTITITDGNNQETVEITLDGDGNGSGDWEVPDDWGPSATFTGPEGTTQVSRPVG